MHRPRGVSAVFRQKQHKTQPCTVFSAKRQDFTPDRKLDGFHMKIRTGGRSEMRRGHLVR